MADYFRQRALDIVRGISRGRTLSYKEVAVKAGRPTAWRAVGSILKTNFDPKIPCHRVVRSDGKIGGYNKGTNKKRGLLLSERARNKHKNIHKNILMFLRTSECFCARRGVELGRKFFVRDTLTVAKELLGKYIVRKIGNKEIIGRIVETEAYIGPQDRASHAYGGKRTTRNTAEYLVGGHIYIYLVYGMYWQFNITTAQEGKPECILVRAVKPVIVDEFKIQNSTPIVQTLTDLTTGRANRNKGRNTGIPAPYHPSRSEDWFGEFKITSQNSKLLRNLANGPGKLCRYLKLDKSFYGEDLTKSGRIWLEDKGERIKPSRIGSSARVGIDYAGPYWSRRKWRFYIKGENVRMK